MRSILVMVLAIGTGLWASGAFSSARVRPPTIAAVKAAEHPTTTTTTTSPVHRVVAGPPSDQRSLTLVDTIGGPISPKSVDASDTGLVFAQNMMYGTR